VSLRLRLTLLSTAVLTAVLATFGAGVYVLLERNLRSAVDAALAQRAGEVARATRVSPQETIIRTLGFSRPNTYVQIVDQAGRVVARSDALGLEVLPVDEAVVAVGFGRRPAFTRDVEVRDTRLRMRAAPLVDQFGEAQGTVLIAAPLDDVAETLRRLRGVMIVAGLAGIGLAAALGWRSARTALRPVEEIARTAHEIGATADLTRRVPVAGPEELGRLAEAFNAMLARLEAAQAALSRSLEAQRRFVDDASHELRTPLTIMRGNLELVARNPTMPAAEREAALRDSVEEAERMTRLVDDLLALARVDAGMPLPDEEVALAPLVRDAIEGTRRRAGDRIVSETIVAEEACVRGSVGLLRRLVENLTDNAVKYTDERGAISVSLVEEGSSAVLTVADDGIGMTPEEAAHAFDRFWRSAASRERPGSGLGLAIAKAVAEAHGGSIEVASEAGAGTTFTVRLPLAPGRAPVPAAPVRAGAVR
jgi:two-component system OmpR family sensor kinase